MGAFGGLDRDTTGATKIWRKDSGQFGITDLDGWSLARRPALKEEVQEKLPVKPHHVLETGELRAKNVS